MDIQLRIPSPKGPAAEAPRRIGRALDRPPMTQVDRDEFIREIAVETGAHAQMIRAVVRAFLAAALRRGDARTPEDWRSVIQDMRYVLGSALSEGVEQVRPVNLRTRPRPPVTVERPAAPRPPIAHDSLIPRIPTLRDDEADLASRQGLPVRLVHALVRAYVASRISGEEGATPEGRSRILGDARELVWDGILEAVKQVPCPPAPLLRKPPPSPRPSRTERER